MSAESMHRPPARITLFGFSPTAADVAVVHRPRSWRATRALLSVGIAVGIAPVVGLLPPHVPWVVLALAVGAYLAGKRWSERYTLHSLAGRCPKCGHELASDSPTKLGRPHTLSCTGCRHELLLEVDVDAIPEATSSAASRDAAGPADAEPAAP